MSEYSDFFSSRAFAAARSDLNLASPTSDEESSFVTTYKALQEAFSARTLPVSATRAKGVAETTTALVYLANEGYADFPNAEVVANLTRACESFFVAGAPARRASSHRRLGAYLYACGADNEAQKQFGLARSTSRAAGLPDNDSDATWMNDTPSDDQLDEVLRTLSMPPRTPEATVDAETEAVEDFGSNAEEARTEKPSVVIPATDVPSTDAYSDAEPSEAQSAPVGGDFADAASKFVGQALHRAKQAAQAAKAESSGAYSKFTARFAEGNETSQSFITPNFKSNEALSQLRSLNGRMAASSNKDEVFTLFNEFVATAQASPSSKIMTEVHTAEQLFTARGLESVPDLAYIDAALRANRLQEEHFRASNAHGLIADTVTRASILIRHKVSAIGSDIEGELADIYQRLIQLRPFLNEPGNAQLIGPVEAEIGAVLILADHPAEAFNSLANVIHFLLQTDNQSPDRANVLGVLSVIFGRAAELLAAAHPERNDYGDLKRQADAHAAQFFGRVGREYDRTALLRYFCIDGD